MAAKPKEVKELFRIEPMGGSADGKGSLYCGYVGGYKLGCVMAPNKTDARKKLMSIARKLLK